MKRREVTQAIIIHCSATKPSMDIGAAEINMWHRKKGWSGIGYHYVIRRNGNVEAGRHPDAYGAHAKGYNHSTVSICLVGGIDEEGKPEQNFTASQFSALSNLTETLKKWYGSQTEVLGHRDLPYVNKDCPCFDVKEILSQA